MITEAPYALVTCDTEAERLAYIPKGGVLLHVIESGVTYKYDINTSAYVVIMGGGPYKAVTNTYSVQAGDFTIDCTSGSFTVTLPTAVGKKGKTYNLVNSSTSSMLIATTSSQRIGNTNPQLTFTLYPGEALTVQSDNANWKIPS